jgi:hypothetical protein
MSSTAATRFADAPPSLHGSESGVVARRSERPDAQVARVRTYRRAAVILALSNAVVCAAVALLRAHARSCTAAAAAADDATVAAATAVAAAAAAAAAPATSAASATLDEVTATAALFLACKLEEEPRGIRDVFNAMRVARDPTAPLICLDSAYWAMKEQVVVQEQQILRSVGFNVDDLLARAQPHRWVFAFSRVLNLSLETLNVALAVANDWQVVEEAEEVEAPVVACAALGIAISLEAAAAAAAAAAADGGGGVAGEQQSGQVVDWSRVGVNPAKVRRVEEAILALYEERGSMEEA